MDYKKPTKDDAELLIKLMELSATPQVEAAMAWIDKELDAKDYAEFKAKYPMGSEGNKHFSWVMANFELAGALLSHGILNENLYFDVSGIGFLWERLGPIAEGMRRDVSPALWENTVWLAARQKEWTKTVWKPNLSWKLKRRPGKPQDR